MPNRRKFKQSESLTSDLTSEVIKSKSSVEIITENIQFVLVTLRSYLLAFIQIFIKFFSVKADKKLIEVQTRNVTMATTEIQKNDVQILRENLKCDFEEDSGHDDVGSHSSARASSDEAETDGGVQVSNSDDTEVEGCHGNKKECKAIMLEALLLEAKLPKTVQCEASLTEAIPCEANLPEADRCEVDLVEALTLEANLPEVNQPETVPGEANPREALPNEVQYTKKHCSSESDTSDDNIAQTEQERALVTAKLVTQLEAMFSDDDLAKDSFLLKHVRRRSDGYVSLKLVSGLRKVKQISRDFPTILEAVKLSLKLDVNLDESKVRRMEPLTPYLKSLPTGKDSRNCTPSNTPRPSIDLTSSELFNREDMKNLASGKRSKRTSTYSSGGSRNGSFSTQCQVQSQGQPGTKIPDLFDRKISCEDINGISFSAMARRGSLPLPILMNGNKKMSLTRGHPSVFNPNQRNSLATPLIDVKKPRQKSNSYCEGTAESTKGMSAWLQRRMSNTRSSEGTIILNGVVRQPRGPDGTKGFFNSEWHTVVGKGKENPKPASVYL